MAEIKNFDLSSDISALADLKVIYTPLHGVGTKLIRSTADDLGLKNLEIVKEQAIIDPDFSTLKTPNPEYPEAFDLAIKLGKEKSADLLVATDPDADRLGLAVRLPDSSYRILNGNQIAALLTFYLLTIKEQQHVLKPSDTIIESIVSSRLPAEIAQSFHVRTIETLTGFKYIAEKIAEIGSSKFIFGFEESYGYLIKPFVHDKDAIQTFAAVLQMTAYYHGKGESLNDILESLYRSYGYFLEKTISLMLTGVDGNERIKNIMSTLRHGKLQKIGSRKISKVDDYLLSGTNFSNVLKFYLDDDWIVVRPSGTEPKLKIYLGVKGSSNINSKQKISELESAIRELIE